jgi:hypothetical protein
MVFDAANSVIAPDIIRLCCQVSDLLNLSDTILACTSRNERPKRAVFHVARDGALFAVHKA